MAESQRTERLSCYAWSGSDLDLAAVWLFASSDPIALRLEDLTVNLRRRHDGQWNMAALLAHLTTPTSPISARISCKS